MDYKWRILPNATRKTPPIRSNLAGGVHGDYLYIIMGAGAGAGRSNEVWRYSLKHGAWEQLEVGGEIPTARDGHSATYVGGGKFLLFGGQGAPTANAKANKVGGEGGASKVRTTLLLTAYLPIDLARLSQTHSTPFMFPGEDAIGARGIQRRDRVRLRDDGLGARVPLRHAAHLSPLAHGQLCVVQQWRYRRCRRGGGGRGGGCRGRTCTALARQTDGRRETGVCRRRGAVSPCQQRPYLPHQPHQPH